jgi:opacity protein-like surface antigen
MRTVVRRKLVYLVSGLALIGSVAAASAQAVPPNYATNGSFAEGYNTYRVAPAPAYAKAPHQKRAHVTKEGQR